MNQPMLSMKSIFLSILVFGASIGVMTSAEEINSINMDQFHYSSGKVIEDRQDDYSAEFTMLAADSVEKVEKYYLNQGFKQDSKDSGSSVITLSRMLSPHVPVTATLVYSQGKSGIFGSDFLLMSVGTGAHSMEELTQLKQKYGYLGKRFYSSDPDAMMKECENPAKTQIAKKKMTAEERGRKMQELMLQGKFEEATAMASSFSEAHQDMQKETTKDRWTDEIKCLEMLDNKSFKVKIKIFIERDDVLG